MTKIKIIILALKKSTKLKFLKKRLKQLKIQFEILYGIDGTNIKNFKILKKHYNEEETKKNIGRSLKFPEIGASLAHLNAYKYILKNNINSAIIIEDDSYPSILLKKWIDSRCKIKNNFILSFYSYPSGYINKKSFKNYLDKKINIHVAKTHIYNGSFYQINLKTCKKIIKLTNGKVTGYSDWPILQKNNIRFATTIPYLTVMDKFNNSTIKRFRNRSNNFLKKMLPNIILRFFRDIFHFFYLGYFFGEMKGSRFYYYHYYQKSLVGFINFFSNKYLDTRKIYFNKNFYAHDLYRDLKIMKKNSDLRI
jgi:GR25 family glycosyltransferase involved in LPS biosynthesis